MSRYPGDPGGRYVKTAMPPGVRSPQAAYVTGASPKMAVSPRAAATGAFQSSPNVSPSRRRRRDSTRVSKGDEGARGVSPRQRFHVEPLQPPAVTSPYSTRGAERGGGDRTPSRRRRRRESSRSRSPTRRHSSRRRRRRDSPSPDRTPAPYARGGVKSPAGSPVGGAGFAFPSGSVKSPAGSPTTVFPQDSGGGSARRRHRRRRRDGGYESPSGSPGRRRRRRREDGGESATAPPSPRTRGGFYDTMRTYQSRQRDTDDLPAVAEPLESGALPHSESPRVLPEYDTKDAAPEDRYRAVPETAVGGKRLPPAWASSPTVAVTFLLKGVSFAKYVRVRRDVPECARLFEGALKRDIISHVGAGVQEDDIVLVLRPWEIKSVRLEIEEREREAEQEEATIRLAASDWPIVVEVVIRARDPGRQARIATYLFHTLQPGGEGLSMHTTPSVYTTHVDTDVGVDPSKITAVPAPVEEESEREREHERQYPPHYLQHQTPQPAAAMPLASPARGTPLAVAAPPPQLPPPPSATPPRQPQVQPQPQPQHYPTGTGGGAGGASPRLSPTRMQKAAAAATPRPAPESIVVGASPMPPPLGAGGSATPQRAHADAPPPVFDMHSAPPVAAGGGHPAVSPAAATHAARQSHVAAAVQRRIASPPPLHPSPAPRDVGASVYDTGASPARPAVRMVPVNRSAARVPDHAVLPQGAGEGGMLVRVEPARAARTDARGGGGAGSIPAERYEHVGRSPGAGTRAGFVSPRRANGAMLGSGLLAACESHVGSASPAGYRRDTYTPLHVDRASTDRVSLAVDTAWGASPAVAPSTTSRSLSVAEIIQDARTSPMRVRVDPHSSLSPFKAGGARGFAPLM